MDREIELIEVFEFQGGNIPMWVYVKGRVDKTAFIDAYKKKYSLEFGPDEKDVVYTHARFIPAGPDLKGETVMWIGQEPGRGAFEITECWIGW